MSSHELEHQWNHSPLWHQSLGQERYLMVVIYPRSWINWNRSKLVGVALTSYRRSEAPAIASNRITGVRAVARVWTAVGLQADSIKILDQWWTPRSPGSWLICQTPSLDTRYIHLNIARRMRSEMTRWFIKTRGELITSSVHTKPLHSGAIIMMFQP